MSSYVPCPHAPACDPVQQVFFFVESYKTVSLVDLVCSNETAQNAEKPMNLGSVCNCEMECPLYWSGLSCLSMVFHS